MQRLPFQLNCIIHKKMLSKENGHRSMGRTLTRTRVEERANARLGFGRLRARSYNTKYGVQKTKNLTIRYTRERKKIDIIQLPLFLSSTLHNSNGTTQCAKKPISLLQPWLQNWAFRKPRIMYGVRSTDVQLGYPAYTPH